MPEVKTDLMARPLYEGPPCPTCNAAHPFDNVFCSDGFHAPGETYWPTEPRTPASAEEIEAVARALAVQNGRAKGNCDCAMCMRAIEVEQDNARAAIAALQATSVNMGEVVEAAADIRWKELAEGSPFTVIDRQMLKELHDKASKIRSNGNAG
jgi:hypothetical protein